MVVTLYHTFVGGSECAFYDLPWLGLAGASTPMLDQLACERLINVCCV